jgi:hypothetical protein
MALVADVVVDSAGTPESFKIAFDLIRKADWFL